MNSLCGIIRAHSACGGAGGEQLSCRQCLFGSPVQGSIISTAKTPLFYKGQDTVLSMFPQLALREICTAKVKRFLNG